MNILVLVIVNIGTAVFSLTAEVYWKNGLSLEMKEMEFLRLYFEPKTSDVIILFVTSVSSEHLHQMNINHIIVFVEPLAGVFPKNLSFLIVVLISIVFFRFHHVYNLCDLVSFRPVILRDCKSCCSPNN